MPNRAHSSKAKRVDSNPSNVGLRLDWGSVLDKLSDGISVHSPTGEIEWANQTLCEMYGKPLSELRAMTRQEAFPEDLSHCRHDEPLCTEAQNQFQTEVSGKVLLVTIEPISDDQSRVVGFIRIVRDVSAERSAMARMEQAERLASLGQMLFGIAHSVGTPLNIISGYSEFLLMRAGPDAHGRKELSAILDQTRRIASLFSEALDMARLPTKRDSGIDLKTLLMSTLELASHHLRRADVKAEVTCVIPPPLIYGEAPQLKQAFFNLIVNAASEIGTGGRMEIVLDQARENLGFVTVVILGTEANGTAHDFSKFLNWFSNPPLKSPSPALGLFLVRQIVESSGAQIISGALGERGVPILVHLPVGGSANPTKPERVNSEENESADSHR
jgi:C4-dicarboxylate-specific signal transduction histidine kinase